MFRKNFTTSIDMSLAISLNRKILKSRASYLLLLCLIFFGVFIVYFTVSKEDAVESANNTLHQQSHVLCVLVPYRDRFEELLEFIPHMSKFLNRQSLRYHIIVINHLQDGYRFNRGSSFNAGFLIMREKFPECDYLAIQDVDTLPLADEVSYTYPGDTAYHGIPPGYHPVRIYTDPTYIGGILLMPNNLFMRVNGFGNNFWGWGFEDLDFYQRMEKYSVPLARPKQLSTDRNNSFRHIHSQYKPRDVLWCLHQAAVSYHTNTISIDHTGISDVNFTISSENYLSIEGFPFSVFNINIQCIFEVTPWCRPFCMNNITMPKSIWEWDIEVPWPDQIFKPGNLQQTGLSQLWDRFFGQKFKKKK